MKKPKTITPTYAKLYGDTPPDCLDTSGVHHRIITWHAQDAPPTSITIDCAQSVWWPDSHPMLQYALPCPLFLDAFIQALPGTLSEPWPRMACYVPDYLVMLEAPLVKNSVDGRQIDSALRDLEWQYTQMTSRYLPSLLGAPI